MILVTHPLRDCHTPFLNGFLTHLYKPPPPPNVNKFPFPSKTEHLYFNLQAPKGCKLHWLSCLCFRSLIRWKRSLNTTSIFLLCWLTGKIKPGPTRSNATWRGPSLSTDSPRFGSLICLSSVHWIPGLYYFSPISKDSSSGVLRDHILDFVEKEKHSIMEIGNSTMVFEISNHRTNMYKMHKSNLAF